MIPIKIPPQNIEAEQAIIAGILINNDMLKIAQTIIEPDDFYRESHQLIYSAMQDLNRRHDPIDLITLSNILKTQGNLEKIGGQDYLMSLSDSMATSAGIPYYSDIVKDCSNRRKLINLCSVIGHEAYKSDLDELTSKVKSDIRDISGIGKNESYDSAGMIQTTYKAIEIKYESQNHDRGVLSGFEAIDRHMFGLAPTEVTVIGGRPNTGKTAFSLNVIDNITDAYPNQLALYFNLESSKEMLTMRRMAAAGNLDYTDIQRGRIQDWARMTETCDLLMRKKNLQIIDNVRKFGTIEDIVNYCELMAMDYKISIIMIDHLQLIRTKRKTISDNDKIGQITRQIAPLAKEINTHLWVISQLNRKVEERSIKKPTQQDFRESGSIEQDTDNLLAMWRPDLEKEIVKIGMLKGRNVMGWWESELILKKEFQKFYDVDLNHTETWHEKYDQKEIDF